MDARPSVRILAQQLEGEGLRLVTELAFDWPWVVVADAHHERRHRVRREGWLQHAELVEDGAERPHVTLLFVLFALAQLGREIEWRAHASRGDGLRVRQHPRYAEVAQAHEILSRQEDVLRLEVSMEDEPIVSML